MLVARALHCDRTATTLIGAGGGVAALVIAAGGLRLPHRTLAQEWHPGRVA
jgi:hypothetical protein